MNTVFRLIPGFMHLVERWRFRLLLTLLVAALFLEPLLDNNGLGKLTMIALFGAILAGAVHVSQPPKIAKYAAFGLVLIWILFGWLRLSTIDAPIDTPLLAIIMILGISVFGFTLRALIVDAEAGVDALAGAVFGYFLLAVLWGLFYLQLEIWSPGAFDLSSEGNDVGSQLLYFSLVTITTLGYGDISPVNPFARICTGVEAAQGTLYLAILIGRAIGAINSQRR